jgi:hypothetical protein
MFLFSGDETLSNELNVDMEKRKVGAIVAEVSEEEMEELQSLGIDVKRKNSLNSKQELGGLASIIKQSMYEDFKLAYSKKGENYREEAMATVNI